MKQSLLFTFLFITSIGSAQSLIQTVNSGSIIGTASSVSIGEIVVVPQNQIQSNSGIIGILVQINQQNLEVTHFELSDKIVVYPNPTVSKIFFKTNENLADEKVSIYNNVGQRVLQKQITSENALDLTELSSGIYLIQFSNKNLNTFKIIKH